MIPPTTNELKQHSNDLINIAKGLHKFNGTSKAMFIAAVFVIALIVVVPFLPEMFAAIVWS